MASSDGSDLGKPVELDDDDLSLGVRRFLEAIAERDSTGATRADRRRELDRERRVSRFAWTCEELNVAFGDLRSDDLTISLLLDHGVHNTLLEVQAKCTQLLASIEVTKGSEEDS
jgi:hypothetical protein